MHLKRISVQNVTNSGTTVVLNANHGLADTGTSLIMGDAASIATIQLLLGVQTLKFNGVTIYMFPSCSSTFLSSLPSKKGS